jgi:hypothetical protein
MLFLQHRENTLQIKTKQIHTMSYKSSETGGAMCLNTAGAATLVSARCSLYPILSAALNAAAL